MREIKRATAARWEEAFKHSTQTWREWEWDRGRWGRGRGGHLLNHFRPHIPVTPTPIIRDHETWSRAVICCLAACLDRISEDSHVLPDCLWSTADGSQDRVPDEKRLVSWSVRPSFELWGAVTRCLAYDSQMCQILKRLSWKNLTPKNKPVSPPFQIVILKKGQSGWIVEAMHYWNKTLNR